MTFQRDKRPVQVISFVSGVDEYGQKRMSGSASRACEMAIYPSSTTLTQDVRYSTVSNVGLTTDKDITDANQIVDGTDTYDVLYVIGSARLQTVLLRKV